MVAGEWRPNKGEKGEQIRQVTDTPTDRQNVQTGRSKSAVEPGLITLFYSAALNFKQQFDHEKSITSKNGDDYNFCLP